MPSACISDSAYVSAAKDQAAAIKRQATIDAAIQVALAMYQRNSSLSIVNMQNEIADRQAKLAEQVQAHAEKFWPEEKELVDDVFSETKHVENYLAAGAIYGQAADSSLQSGREDWINISRTMCLSPTRCEDARWSRNAQVAKADILSYSARQEEARTQILNDRRYAWQLNIIGLGKGQLGELLKYQQINGAIAGNIGGFIEGSINSALQAYGYYSYRRPPEGWSAGIRDVWRMPQPTYEPVAPAQPPVVVQNTQPIVPVPQETGKAAGMGSAYRDASGRMLYPVEGGGYVGYNPDGSSWGEFGNVPQGFSKINGSL